MIDFELPFKGNFPITLDYGAQIPSQFGGGKFYDVDFGTPRGTPIESSWHGVVANVEWNRGGGNLVTINHPSNPMLQTRYAHLDKVFVKPGQAVTKDTVIGLSGNTGEFTTGPHLLFGARVGGQPIDPIDLLNEGPTGIEITEPFPFNGDSDDQGFLGVPGAIGDAAITLGFILLGGIILIAGVLIMRAK